MLIRFTLYTQVIEKSLLPFPLQCSITSENPGEGIVTQVLKVGENLRSEGQLALNNTGEQEEITSPSLQKVIDY